ncbi:MAG: DUF1549 and DUF1553 domain-containing protein [Planctomycetota bacterium]|mgnify:FL=1|nr:DUF1549 and DUF1553 domain-containing protein [Planctomycetota bacterium]
MKSFHFVAGFVCVAAVAASTVVADADELRASIDQRIEAAWQVNKVKQAEPATDAEFLRRVFLDLHGVIPSREEAAAFLDDASPDKRSKLIDTLLEHPRFAIHQSDVWDLIYFTRNPPGYDTDKRQGFQNWLREQFENDVPYNEWVKSILRAEGDTVKNGSPMFYVMYKSQPEDATEAITQKFLGIQLQCARCHDHPFEEWKQTDFYGFAGFLSRLQVVDVGTVDKQKAYAIGEMNTGDVLFTGPVTEQKRGQKGEPVKPKFLGGDPLVEPELPEDVKDPRNFPNGKQPPAPHFSRKNALADWITSPDNPYFARAAANRIWAQFMGKGIVHPVDNLSPANPPCHPELLDELSKELVAHKFDLKWLIREIVNSRAYQLSASGDNTEAMPLWFERARYRPLSAEELFESWLLASGYQDAHKASGKEPEDRFNVRGFTWDYMRRFFGRPNDGMGNFQGGMQEHLYLNNGQIHQLISKDKGSLYDYLATSESPMEERVERLFLQVLSRKPDAEETAQFVTHLSAEDDQRNRIHEAIWTLMSCSEFRFNH